MNDGTSARKWTFQPRMVTWLFRCFDRKTANSKTERSHRFGEEAIELLQAAECPEQDVIDLVRYVYGRPVGELRQEVGGVMTTLTALCHAHDVCLVDAAEAELARINTKIPEIRAKHAAKKKDSALPGYAEQPKERPLSGWSFPEDLIGRSFPSLMWWRIGLGYSKAFVDVVGSDVRRAIGLKWKDKFFFGLLT